MTDIKTKSIAGIIAGNTFTFFNILNVVLAALVFMAGSYENALFMGVVIANLIIGITQEIRAKLTLDRLNLIYAPKAVVILDNAECEAPPEELNAGDITKLKAGMQVCADCAVISGTCEVNESLLTGEAEPVYKKDGDLLLSGSFVICGTVLARVTEAGGDSFAAKITARAKAVKQNKSEIYNSLDRMVKLISVFIVPIALILFYKSFFVLGEGRENAIVSVVAAIIGVIPEGLVLLTGIVLAMSAIRLSLCNTLVRDLFSIEALARVDTLCLDKTGTITEGVMRVERLIELNAGALDELALFARAVKDDNPTAAAVKDYTREISIPQDISVDTVTPFSSERKFSGAVINGVEYKLCAADGNTPEINSLYEKGLRVLQFTRNGRTTALIGIGDRVRDDARDTLDWFYNQGVDIKIISGDSPVTASRAAARAGVKNAEKYIDASDIPDGLLAQTALEYTVFGRVEPARKRDIIAALKSAGRVTGMTGDGVNDVLALKEADCGVAMQSGCDAARRVADLVLLDSRFSSMPKAVAEGRRSINNLERSAALFLTKTVYSMLLAAVYVVANAPYPLIPVQMTLVSAMFIGLPGLFLSVEPNISKISGRFFGNVMRKAFPLGAAIALSVCGAAVASYFLKLSAEETRTVAVAVLGVGSVAALVRVCMPLNLLRAVMIIALCGAFAAGLLLFDDLLDLTWR